MRLVVVTLCDGVTMVVDGVECPALHRVLAACQLLGVEAQHTVHPFATASRAAELYLRAHAWVLIGYQLSSRVRALRAAAFTGSLYVLETASPICEGEGNLLDAGADCYSSEPIDQSTMAARLRSLLRHRSGTYAAYRSARAELRESEGLLIVGRNTYVLSPRELTLLRYLSDRAGCWVPRDQLLRELFGAQKGHDPSVVRTHLLNIKKKLGSDHWILQSDRLAGVMFLASTPEAANTSRAENARLGDASRRNA